MQEITPLFPLRLVIYPGSKYMLHIFEERYKQLVSSAINDNTVFGIVIVKDDSIERIGTYVRITGVLKEYTDGSFDIMVEGLNRFVVKKFWLGSEGYFLGRTEDYSDNSISDYFNLFEKIRDKFELIITKADFKLDDSFWTNLDEAKLKSFKLAEKSGLTLEQQQELLTKQNEAERLYLLMEHFDNLIDYFDNKRALHSLIMNDGYVN
ncbi:MAG: LON peptidase substrate-binding domain-containing protein [Ignavibacteriaceae bacterium]|nr:LON peptidase substrate-binding domain-containing protein [Ignavibacteriaceae bacterium]